MMRNTKSIHPDMTLLDIVSEFRETEAVFKKYGLEVGACLCCEALFETLGSVAVKYRLSLAKLLFDLQTVVRT